MTETIAILIVAVLVPMLVGWVASKMLEAEEQVREEAPEMFRSTVAQLMSSVATDEVVSEDAATIRPPRLLLQRDRDGKITAAEPLLNPACKWCGNIFHPDRRGRCASCGGPR